eukprot:TRINITY_DN459_c0_g1_i3.p1 TRINITY_DN459_c0_g1~~TRINITY_DN459_c0_g1_i3.p1  ORF type:complete len:806 (+),score=98.60 TRINITY_DN459_c0_g1_i3:47-2464(+)
MNILQTTQESLELMKKEEAQRQCVEQIDDLFKKEMKSNYQTFIEDFGDFESLIKEFTQVGIAFGGKIIDAMEKLSDHEIKSTTFRELEKILKLYRGSIETIFISKDSNNKIKNSFQDKFQGTNVEKFEKYLKKSFAMDESYNYTAVFQSSGYGKTRLVTTFGETTKNFYAIYWCLRLDNSSGFPPRSETIRAFFATLLKTSSAEEVISEIKNLFNNVIRAANAENDTTTFWKKYTAPLYTDTGENYEKNSSSLLIHSTPITTSTSSLLPMVIIIDEASFLLSETKSGKSLFRIMRAIAASEYSQRLFLVFVDTVPIISNFSSPSELDRSLRQTGYKIRYPFISVSTIDLDFQSEQNQTQPSLEFDLKRAFTYGRPLWRIYANNMGEGLSVARVKLIYSNNKKIEALPQAIAVLAARVNIVVPVGQLACTLVASYMATCVGVSQDRDYVFAQYISEPLLAEAAAKLWHEGDNLKTILDLYHQAILGSRVNLSSSKGHRGEQIFPIRACLLKDQIVKEKTTENLFYTCEIDLIEWIVQFAPKNFDKICYAALKEGGFEEAKISFTHFSKLYNLGLCRDQKGLQFLYNRACAVIFSDVNQRGAEYLIPCRIGTVYGGLLVQLKTYSDQTSDNLYPASASFKLSEEFVFKTKKSSGAKYFGLYLVKKDKTTKEGTLEVKGQTKKKSKEYFDDVVIWNKAKMDQFLSNKLFDAKSVVSSAKFEKEVNMHKSYSNYNCLAIRKVRSGLKMEIENLLDRLSVTTNSPLDCIPDEDQKQTIAQALFDWVEPPSENRKRKVDVESSHPPKKQKT